MTESQDLPMSIEFSVNLASVNAALARTGKSFRVNAADLTAAGMKPMPPHSYATHMDAPPLQPGRLFEGSVCRTGDGLNAAVVLEALARGWVPEHYDPELLGSDAAVADGRQNYLDYDDEALSDAASEALDWLSEHAAPEGYVCVFDDGVDVVAESELDI